jgi:hypothetical protein
MLVYIGIAFIAFALGALATIIKTNNTVTQIVNSEKESNEKSYNRGHKDGWHAALNDRLMVASKYHEYYRQDQN